MLWAGVLGVLALTPSLAGAATSSPPREMLHEVAPGDGLRLIAGYYYGDTRQWKRIWDANRPLVRNPNLLEQGISVRVPDATPPKEPYEAFVARTRRAAPPPGVPVPGAPSDPAPGPTSPSGTKAR
jgi:phage tail protein X